MLNKARLRLSIWKDVISGHCFQWLWNVNISLPGHRSLNPGQLETWGCMTQANGISCSFPICEFNHFHSWASIPEKHTDIHKTPTGWGTGCHSKTLLWQHPLNMSTSGQTLSFSGRHRRSLMQMHTWDYLSSWAHVHSQVPQVPAWSFCLPGSPAQIPGPLTGPRGSLITGWSSSMVTSKQAVLVYLSSMDSPPTR